MAQQYNNPNAQNIKKRYADELVNLMQSQKAVLFEHETEGPIKKVCFVSNQLSAVAIQEEQYM